MFETSTLKLVIMQSFKWNRERQVLDEHCLIWVFLDWDLKKLLPYLKSVSLIFFRPKFRVKIKIYNFGTKIALTGYLWAGIWKTVVIFEINTLVSVKAQIFVQK